MRLHSGMNDNPVLYMRNFPADLLAEIDGYAAATLPEGTRDARRAAVIALLRTGLHEKTRKAKAKKGDDR